MQQARPPMILVIDDEAITLNNLSHILQKEGYDVVAVDSGTKALGQLNTAEFDLVITDYKMDKVDGFQVLAQCRKLQPYTEVVLITGYATVDMAVQAMRDGAYFYIAKPFKIEMVRKVVKEALFKRKLQTENRVLKQKLAGSRSIPTILGDSEAIRSVRRTIEQIAASEANVLICGETGTGKELAAKAIHSLSLRAENKFVAFNCGALTEDLMANELFGHEKGAFTGAHQDKLGLLETAGGGTMLLDEIGDMPSTMQVKLLRAIQEGEILRVGGVAPIPIDVRFIAATHRDLQREVDEGAFRQDLYYRLNVIALNLPPLTAREGDIPVLIRHFIRTKSLAAQKKIHDIDSEAMALLCRHSWPGNVRELENVIERAIAMGRGPKLRADEFPEYINRLSIETYRRPDGEIPSLEEQEKRYIRWVLEKCNGNKTRAAKIMGIDRVSLWRKLKRFHITEA
ncbi:MAG: sigma-54-dependent Fis family transcriptional regulator [Deltaproteobacteria bacterium]|nr:sigma-54-dependent Fis family transcriptional regulator [Deltaproteobacteria bacterium]